MSALASNVNVIVATLGLAEVQSVIDAIKAVDQGSGREASPAGIAAAPDGLAPCQSVFPNPCYAPRQIIHPEPRYEPRPVLHPTPRVEWQGCAPAWKKCEPPHITPGPPPPWKILPQAATAVPIAQNIKIVLRQPDYIDRGRLIDLFI
jgi:hypothetical protein